MQDWQGIGGYNTGLAGDRGMQGWPFRGACRVRGGGGGRGRGE